ncbi:MAG: DUF4270 domain-containing protein, partial [Bacteroidaceae bacterium]|nr:DUF4270 domain-containing protein [Bacteroidaceae bacterium]
MLTLAISGCDEDTGTLGIYPNNDAVSHSTAVYNFSTRSVSMDNVLCNSTNCFLGNIIDPETNSQIQADFAAQFHTFENHKFPKKEAMFPQDGKDYSNESVSCDSCEIRIFFDSYYGDGNSLMKLEVYPLDINNIIEENQEIYSNVDLGQFVKKGTEPLAVKMFTPIDYTLSDADRNSTSHNKNIQIKLPKEYGDYLLNAYYTDPDNYKDSYSFIRNVCPGFYFKLKNGSGAMINVKVSALNVYFTYYDAEKTDTTYNGYSRFAATPEVIQATKFNNSDLQDLVNEESCTYLKTPAGICTEVTLPITEIYESHQTDSVSKARLTLTRINNKRPSDFSLGIPQKLLLVRKDEMNTFFSERKVSDSRTSYTTTFDAVYNTYTFENICRLVSFCNKEKLDGMKLQGISEEEWEKANPNWNKVVLIPVDITTTQDSYGYTKEVSITHDMNMNSVRLVGGKN